MSWPVVNGKFFSFADSLINLKLEKMADLDVYGQVVDQIDILNLRLTKMHKTLQEIDIKVI